MFSWWFACVAGPGPDLVVAEVVPLGTLPPEAGPASGVVVDEDGAVYLLANGGVFGVDGAPVATTGDLMDALGPADPSAPWESVWVTDGVALGGGMVAVTIPGNGLRVDVDLATADSFFCYLPGATNVASAQITDAVTYDPEQDLIYAQPVDYVGGEAVAAAIGVWDGALGGEPTAWFPLPDRRFDAGAMAFDGGQLLFAEEAVLWRTGLRFDDLYRYVDLGATTNGEPIVGLALDADDGLTLATEAGRVVHLQGWRPK